MKSYPHVTVYLLLVAHNLLLITNYLSHLTTKADRTPCYFPITDDIEFF